MCSKEDIVRMHHILDAAKEAVSFAQGQARKSLDKNRMLVLSLVKDVEIIGEAAANVSKDCRERFSHIPWKSIINMRNRLIHAYFDINLDIVWQTVTKDLPSLIIKLEEIPFLKNNP
ncbi:hypothetical protein KsCSTR_09040 [Candidatus Kuenenia stuttgartiensis]|jgi:uncharacterized protein with HEPN domain|uniref:DUF86 domain-containing protein n=1 Tax=Kuenenia stuttgartiensis TaxID=174633 RepID=Q1PZ41_KUEST|nr:MULTISPECIES: DUF86 domain-containing protein [Kuenenia]MBE7547393.1 DUF86 domain-containing protein [Planctomycetia bacterium]MBW7942643.1 DUF86 domain-containing protein [Candidatus Kuenenia stuttgartiensis]MBZ0190618.1 DUF86 domain-containing protein [Candidatus Kuenenia stuttgartiensis]MCF6151795.1 DUF86 domain-containing protein [Candidatus Kuenenia stuttgartiensis]MCL4726347.1 DUF86 domain-containing protein [Candidatus Kuenenia stuttgartiensis]